MATYNPITPDSLYGELQPETFGAGMKGEHFGPEITAMMLPTEGLSRTEMDRATEGYQKNIMPLRRSLAQARAAQDKQAMDLVRFRMTQEGHRMSQPEKPNLICLKLSGTPSRTPASRSVCQ